MIGPKPCFSSYIRWFRKVGLGFFRLFRGSVVIALGNFDHVGKARCFRRDPIVIAELQLLTAHVFVQFVTSSSPMFESGWWPKTIPSTYPPHDFYISLVLQDTYVFCNLHMEVPGAEIPVEDI